MTKQIPSIDADINKLPQALLEMQKWRDNKAHAGESIPDKLWLQIFALEGLHTASQLCTLFKISHKQYTSNHKKLFDVEPAKADVVLESTASEFCEATLIDDEKPAPANGSNINFDVNSNAPPKVELGSPPTPSPYAKDPLPKAETMIVELCRKDGAILKIHTTQDSIDIVMDKFYKGI